MMSQQFFYTFPAVRGIQAQRPYFVITCPLNVLPKLFVYNEIEDISPEFRAQRVLNKTRIPEMAEYILENPQDYVFSSITASVSGSYEFIEADAILSKDLGVLKISMDSQLLINDGQHRKYAIEEALKANPSLGEETISVVLLIDQSLKRSQQIFSDLNKHAVNVSKSIGILYDSRDDLALLTKELLDHYPKLMQYTDLENTSLSKFSNKLFLLSNIYKCNKIIVGKQNISDPTLRQFIFDFWKELLDNIYEWNMVFNKETSPFHLRKEYVCTYGVVLEAFGFVGHSIFDGQIKDWKTYMKKIEQIDWSRSNLTNWGHRVISDNGRIQKNATCIRLTANLIKTKIGLSLSDDEKEYEKQLS